MSRIDVTDSNAYLGKWPYWNMEVNTGDQLAKHLRKNGIDRALVSSLRSAFVDAEDGNLELLEACKKHPDTLFGLATLTPFSKKKGAGIQALTSGIFKGIRLCPQHHGYPLANASRIIETAEDLRVPVVLTYRLIMSWNLPTISLGEVMSLVQENRKVNFVLSGANYDAAPILSLRKKPANLFIETSCLQMWDGARHFIEDLGPDRVLMGTGTPVQYAQSGTSNVLDSTLSVKQKKMVASSNARALFRL
jgi:predicted TIM-barrel fold metal-dependent hydrolase